MKINQLKVGAVLSYLSMGIGYLISIIYTPIMLRLLGQNEYGLYNLVASIVSYLGVLNFGFGSAYMRYYSRYKIKDDKKIAQLNGMFLIIFIIISIVSVIAGTILALNTDLIFGNKLSVNELLKAKILMFILVLNISVSFPNIVFSSYIMANEKFIFQKVVQMIKLIINPFVILPVLIMGYGSVGMVITTTILNTLIEIINVIYCVQFLKMKFIFKDFDFKLMKEMTIFSSYIFMNLIIDQINWNLDKFILGRFHGTISVAVYGLAAQLNTYYLTISSAISNVFVPRIHRLVAINTSNETLTELFTRIGRMQFIILSLISSVLIFFGKPFINLWAGANYTDSYPIALLLIIPVTITLIQNIGTEILRAKNLHKFRSWVYLIIAIINLIVTIPLAKAYGGVGASFGTAMSLIIGNGFIMNWYYHEKVGLNMLYFWKKIVSFFPSFLIPIIFGILSNYMFNLYKLSNLLLLGVIYIIVFFISMWVSGMNQYEKDLLNKPIKRLFNKFFN